MIPIQPSPNHKAEVHPRLHPTLDKDQKDHEGRPRVEQMYTRFRTRHCHLIELFLEWLAVTATEIAKADNRKTIKYEDLAHIVAKDERASFLNGK